MAGQLDDGEFDFEDVETQLEEDNEGLTGKVKKNAEEVYDFTKQAVGKSGAVGAPVGAGAAALLNQPVELGAGAGLSASMLYDIAKYQMETDRGMDLEDLGFAGGMTALPSVGGYAASKREDIAEYAGEAAETVTAAGEEAYDAVAGLGTDVANYVMTEGPQVANDIAASSDEAAMGVGAGIASLLGGTYVMGKAYDKLSSDEEDEFEIEEDYQNDDW